MAKLLWTQRQSIRCRTKVGRAMAYDRARKQVVLFGGNAGNGCLFGDTWMWDGSVRRVLKRLTPTAA